MEALALPDGTPWWGFLILIVAMSTLRLLGTWVERKYPPRDEPDDEPDGSVDERA